MNQTKVILFQVRKSSEKLKKIFETSQSHFQKKESLLILTENEAASEYVDHLLWNYRPTSFLPHIISHTPTSEKIVISHAKINLNSTQYVFNLNPTPLLIESPFKIIYDFEDMTSSSKNRLSSLRFDAYKKAGFIIEASF